jgi:S1-C subfamily serine protease
MGRLALFLLLMMPPHSPQGSDYDPAFHGDTYRFAEKGMKDAAASSIIITAATERGSVAIGSGNYFHIHGHRFILTAAHVVDGFAAIAVTERSGDIRRAEVVHVDHAIDMAIIIVEEPLRFTKPVDYRPSKKIDIGKEVFYCGHPNQMYFTSYHGRISGLNGQYILVDTFAWPGSSGSVVFGKGGKVIGTVSAVSMDAPTGVPVLVPHFVRIGPTLNYSRKFILEVLLDVCRN